MGKKIQQAKRIAATAIMGTLGIPAGVIYAFGKIWYETTTSANTHIKNPNEDDRTMEYIVGGLIIGPIVATAICIPVGIQTAYEKAHEIACDKISMPKQENSNASNVEIKNVLSRFASINPIESDVNVNAEYTTDSENDLRSLSDDPNHQKDISSEKGSALLSSLKNVDDNNTHPNVASHAIGPHQPTNSALHPDKKQKVTMQSKTKGIMN